MNAPALCARLLKASKLYSQTERMSDTSSQPLDILQEIIGSAFGPGMRVYPLWLGSFIVAAFLIYLLRHKKLSPAGFFSWAFPREIYFHPSHITDIKLFALGRLLTGLGVLLQIGTPVFAATGMIVLLSVITGQNLVPHEPLDAPGVIGVTLLLTLTSDFCVYWVHRIHHEHGALWPFHSVHHSAEVLAPLTVYRKHPVYDILSDFFTGIVIGFAQGAVIFFITGQIEIALLGGTNAFIALFNMTSANFRHSHIWLGFGPFWEHIFVSPAQHQIHHSRAPRHHNKNYGEIFALWDWFFGTLYIPQGEEKIEFGLADVHGNAIAQPHKNLREALIVPFIESAHYLKKSTQNTRQRKSGPGAQNP